MVIFFFRKFYIFDADTQYQQQTELNPNSLLYLCKFAF